MITDNLPRFTRPSARARTSGWPAAVCAFALFLATADAKPILPAGLAGFPAAGPTAESDRASTDNSDDLPLGAPQFDTTPVPLPPNAASLGHEAAATSEFGDLVRLSGAAHFIDSVTVTLSTSAIRSDYAGSSPFGFTHPVTLKLYSVDRTGAAPRAGAVIATLQHAFLIPWRPEPHATSTAPSRPWRAANGKYYSGLAFNLTFDLGALGLTLPDEVIFGVSFNTHHYGDTPIGVAGPYDRLGVVVASAPPVPGVDIDTDAVFWRTANAAAYTDGGAAGVNVFRSDTGWTPYTPAIRFTNSAYGTLADTAAALRTLHSGERTIDFALSDAATLLSFALPRGFWDGHNRLQLDGGGPVFELIAEAAQELATVAATRDAHAAEARRLLTPLLGAAQSLAETALGDAIIAGGDARRISRSQDALDRAQANVSASEAVKAVDAYNAA
ncbi:MAG TPA: hypothetical protein VM029_04215, partial [Opitutaceae bacterium]|nr:hypothetical protein [Opitutaceae bacterium]